MQDHHPESLSDLYNHASNDRIIKFIRHLLNPCPLLSQNLIEDILPILLFKCENKSEGRLVEIPALMGQIHAHIQQYGFDYLLIDDVLSFYQDISESFFREKRDDLLNIDENAVLNAFADFNLFLIKVLEKEGGETTIADFVLFDNLFCFKNTPYVKQLGIASRVSKKLYQYANTNLDEDENFDIKLFEKAGRAMLESDSVLFSSPLVSLYKDIFQQMIQGDHFVDTQFFYLALDLIDNPNTDNSQFISRQIFEQADKFLKHCVEKAEKGRQWEIPVHRINDMIASYNEYICEHTLDQGTMINFLSSEQRSRNDFLI
jgi:hypothetical protein